MRPPDEKRPTGISGRAHLDTVRAGERDGLDDTTSDLFVEPADDWARRIRKAADDWMSRQKPARRIYRGGRR